MNYEAPENPSRFSLFPEGKYEAELLSYEEKLSKTGNEMVELKMKVYGSDGSESNIFDYLVGTKGMAWKIKAFCMAAGLPYGQQPLPIQQAVGKLFQVKVVTESYDGKDRNKIDDYYPLSEGTQQQTSSAKGSTIPDSDLPF